MKIAIAQIEPVPGDLYTNLEMHMQWIRKAAGVGADMIFFPELSISGYEPSLASELCMSANDDFWKPIQSLCDDLEVAAGLGVPLQSQAGIQIAMLIFQPWKPILSYSKKLLHPDELAYFEPGNQQVLIPIGEEFIAPAICYESLQESHISVAKAAGATVYVASVAKHARGMERAKAMLSEKAKALNIPILLCNCFGPADDFVAAGGSEVWNRFGISLNQLSNHKPGILIYDTTDEHCAIIR